MPGLSPNRANLFPRLKPFPGGAMFRWRMSDVNTTNLMVVPNRASNRSPSKSIFMAPRRMFSQVWGGGQCVDNVATAPDGTSQASTITVASGNWWMDAPDQNITLTSGQQYTMCISARSNTGSNQTFVMKSFSDSGATSSNKTLTSSWQRYTFSWTPASTGGKRLMLMASFDGATGISADICDAEVFIGGADLNPDWTQNPLDGHLTFGSSKSSNAAVYSSGAVNVSAGNSTGFTQLATPRTLSTFTFSVLMKKTAAAGTWNPVITKTSNRGTFAVYCEGNGSPSFSFGAAGASITSSGDIYGSEYRVVTHVFDGAASKIYYDGVLVQSTASSTTTAALDEFSVGCMQTFSFNATLSLAEMAMWDRALSADEIYTVCGHYWDGAKRNGLLTPAFRGIEIEGDSIVNGGYVRLYAAASSPTVYGNDASVPGTGLAQFITRSLGYRDFANPAQRKGRRYIYYVQVTGNGAYVSADWVAFLDDMRSRGWYVVLGTQLPRNDAPFNATRATINTELRTWVGVHCDVLIDFDNPASNMGADADAADTSKYSDGTHPTTTGSPSGQQRLATYIATQMNAIV